MTTDTLTERIEALCSTLTEKAAHDDGRPTYKFSISDTSGPKFIRIVMSYGTTALGYRAGHVSVHAFVERSTGSLIKAGGWKAPQKDKGGLAVRGNLLDDDDFARILNECDPFGSYLYKK
jgi:hypothetical protein